MRKRSGQNSSARRIDFGLRAVSSSPSVTTRTCEHSSGTSVNGLPIMMPADERGAVALHALALADQVAVAAGLGDQFVAAHQRRDDDAGNHRLDPALHAS